MRPNSTKTAMALALMVMGAAPAWQAVLTSNIDGKSMTLVLEACQSA